MNEKPVFRVIEGGKTEGGLSETQAMDLAVAREFVLANAPENWQQAVEEERVHSLRQEIMHWSYDELSAYCQALDVWEDPTKTRAVLEVIAGKTMAA